MMRSFQIAALILLAGCRYHPAALLDAVQDERGPVCAAPYAIDGDTIACANYPAHVRLLGIDAPELPGHCRRGRICTPGDGYEARAVMVRLLSSGTVRCAETGHDKYRRILARCTVAHRAPFGRLHSTDVSCAMLASGEAVRRYSRIDCP